MRRSAFRALIAGAVTVSLTLPTSAVAQSSGSSLAPLSSVPSWASSMSSLSSTSSGGSEADGTAAGSSDAFLRDFIVNSSEYPDLNGSSLEALLSSMSLVGSSEVALSGPLISSEANYPLPTDPTITTPEIVDKRPDNGLRLERWTVASPAMQRNVEVQIMRSADANAPAPMLYLLDGIGGARRSGWMQHEEGPEVFAEENVTVVMPTGAAASMYSDWVEEDPALGIHMWETFITEELAPLLEKEEELNFNGRRGIGGLSMGATGAVHLANTNPEMFDAVIGISGCYSTMDPIGRQMASLIVNSRGGDVENMWGPFGSETWQFHDTVSHPEGLRDMAVYLSAANGVIAEEDREDYEDDPFYNMLAGVVLERGVLSCTQDLDQAMQEAGMDHHVVDYKDSGVHNWPNYIAQLQPGWDAVKDSLY